MTDTSNAQTRAGLGEPGTVREHHEHHDIGFVRKYIFSTDHKIIGIQFLITVFFTLMLGGFLALVDEAVARLVEMRTSEGSALRADLRKHASGLAKLVARIEKRMSKRFPALNGVALADDLAGDDEIKVIGLHPLAGLADHETLAVQAGVQIGAVTVLRVDDDLLVFLDDLDHVEFDTQLFRHPQGIVALGAFAVLAADGVGMTLDAETGVEIDPLDMHPLVEYQTGRQHGVQATGNQGDCFSRFAHRAVCRYGLKHSGQS